MVKSITTRKSLCGFPECARIVSRSGYCYGHYTQKLDGKVLSPISDDQVSLEVCSFEGCESSVRARGYCTGHYYQYNKGLELKELNPRSYKSLECDFSGCDRSVESSWLCRTHARQKREGRDLSPIKPRRKRNGVTGKGYKLLHRPDHPNSTKHGQIMEHVLVMSDHLNRPLRAGENVHHLYGHKLDNRIENLELWITTQPSGQRVSDRVKHAVEIIETYKMEYPDLVEKLKKGFRTMPSYEFQCKNCNHFFEVTQSIHDDDPSSCPSCREDALRKIFSIPGVSFKGQGFYTNDQHGPFIRDDTHKAY